MSNVQVIPNDQCPTVKKPAGVFKGLSDLRSKLLQSDDRAVSDLFFIFCHGPSTFLPVADFFPLSNHIKIKPIKSTLLIGYWTLGFHWALEIGHSDTCSVIPPMC